MWVASTAGPLFLLHAIGPFTQEHLLVRRTISSSIFLISCVFRMWDAGLEWVGSTDVTGMKGRAVESGDVGVVFPMTFQRDGPTLSIASALITWGGRNKKLCAASFRIITPKATFCSPTKSTIMTNQIALEILVIYVCGALAELLIRLSLGTPTWAKPAFEKNVYLVALQPVVFILLPALIWPLVLLHHLFRPVCNRIVKCCAGRKQADNTAAAPAPAPASSPTTSTAEGAIPLSTRSSMASTVHDLEKQEMHFETSSRPSAPEDCITKA